MRLRDKIFNRYYSIHGKFLEKDIVLKQRWFNNLCEANYASHLPIPGTGARILEVGCGRGYILKWMQGRGLSNIEGMDLSPEDVEFAKKHVGIDSIYCVDGFEYLQKKECIYDCIIGKSIFEHIEKAKLEEFLGLIKNALKPKGKVILQVPNMDWIMAQHERYMDLTHEVGFTKESLGEILRLYFDDVTIYPVVYEFPQSLKSQLRIRLLRSVAVKLVRLLFKLLGEGAADTWFEYRGIIGIAKKER
ncbi:Ubiquinone biosynthesis O-methyltransferase, mitochondrial [subsurface metagenome]